MTNIKDRKNNFDILRIALASTVLFFHIGVLTGDSNMSKAPGEFAVHCFFIISGYLIVRSYIRNSDLTKYARARALRIYPLYCLVVFLCFILGGVLYDQSFIDYFRDGGGEYLLYNLIFLNFLSPDLPELFQNNLYSAVNGSLWTIKIEVMFYLSVPLIYGVFAKNRNSLYVTISIGLLSALCAVVIESLVLKYDFPGSLRNQLPSMMMYFMVGAAFNFIEYDSLKQRHLLVIVPMIVLCNNLVLIYPVLVGLVVGIVAFKARVVTVPKNIGDISYGIYIWHFPVIQLCISQGLFDDYLFGVCLSSSMVFMLAFFSWHLLEKKMLGKRLKH